MHHYRTYEQSRKIGQQCIDKWKEDDEENYASWFVETYFTPPWDTWYCGAAGEVSGVLPNQNPIESFHGAIKKALLSLRASTPTVLNVSLPTLLRLVAQDLKTPGMPDQRFNHFAEGPIPGEFFYRAQILVGNKRNFIKLTVSGNEEVRAVVFNADTCIVEPHKGVSVTMTRIKRYSAALKGDMVPSKKVTDAPLLYMSLYQVTVREDHPPLSSRPIWKTRDINTVRRTYTCDCKTRRESGWVCEHVLATMPLLSRMDLEESNLSIPVGRRPGRPRKTRALERDCRESDRSDKGFFSKSNLIKMLTESSARIYNWSLIKEFTYDEDGHITKEFLSGRIFGWQINGGRYAWSVRFSNDEVHSFECEELADLLSFSAVRGLDVTPPQ